MKSGRGTVSAIAIVVLLFGIAAWQAANAQNEKRRAEDQENEIARLRDELRQCGGSRLPVRGDRYVPPPAPPIEAPVAFDAPAPRRQPDTKTKGRFITVTAKCQAAEEAYEQIRATSAQLGQKPHPDIMTAFSRMEIALDAARQEMDDGQTWEARESLDNAETSANKVLRAAGGR